MSPRNPTPVPAPVEDALFALILALLERAASADRGARMEELARLTFDLDLFARAALSARTYVSEAG